MKNIWLLFILGCTLFSCSDEPKKEKTTTELPDEKLSAEDLIRRKVIAELSIPATENYTLEIHKKKMDDDEFEDAVVLVNRKEYVLQKSVEKNRTASDEKLSYFGQDSYMFYYDGMSHTVTRPIAVPTSGLIPLKINFHNIQTEAYFDFTLDTRIQETRWRNFYTVTNGVPKLVFQWNVQNHDENGKLTATHFSFDRGSYSLAKDILIYDAELLSKLPSNLMSDYEIKTKPVGEPLYRFFYNPSQGKYFTNK